MARFFAWWFGAGLFLEVAGVYIVFAGDWGCSEVLNVSARMMFLGLLFRVLPSLLVAWVPALAEVTGEVRKLAVFRGLSLSWEDVRYTEVSRIATKVRFPDEEPGGPYLGPKKIIFAVRITGHATYTSGPFVQVGPYAHEFVFDKLDDARQKLGQIGDSHPVKRLAAMPWLGFCVTETSLLGRITLSTEAALCSLLYGACFVFQGYYICVAST